MKKFYRIFTLPFFFCALLIGCSNLTESEKTSIVITLPANTARAATSQFDIKHYNIYLQQEKQEAVAESQEEDISEESQEPVTKTYRGNPGQTVTIDNIEPGTYTIHMDALDVNEKIISYSESASTIVELGKTSTVNLTMHWNETKVTVTLEELAEKIKTVRNDYASNDTEIVYVSFTVTGAFPEDEDDLAEAFDQIRDAMQSVQNAKIELDLSGTTGLTKLESIDSEGKHTGPCFYNTKTLSSIVLPASIELVGNTAFACCTSLTSITVSSDSTKFVSKEGILYQIKSKTETLRLAVYPMGRTDPSFTIPSDCSEIGNSTFWGAENLQSVTIPDSVTYIGFSAFKEMPKLTSINIPDSVTEIRLSAFEGCTSLSSVTIGEGVTFIGKKAFNGCTSLSTLNIKNKGGWFKVTDGSEEGKKNAENKTGGTTVPPAELAAQILANPTYYWYCIPTTTDEKVSSGESSDSDSSSESSSTPSSTTINAMTESDFLAAVSEAQTSSTHTVTLTGNVIITKDLELSKIGIDGQGKYGLIVEANITATTVGFVKGAGTITQYNGENKRFGMIYWNNGKSDAQATFTDCSFTKNSTTGDIGGGALALFGNGKVTITTCLFKDNVATHGGAIDIGGGDSVTLTNCIFSNNTTKCQEDVYLGGSAATITGSRNTSDSSTPYQCYSAEKDAPDLFAPYVPELLIMDYLCIEVGQNHELRIQNADGTLPSATLTSSDVSVATLSSSSYDGTNSVSVTGLAPGLAYITATTDTGKTAVCPVLVHDFSYFYLFNTYSLDPKADEYQDKTAVADNYELVADGVAVIKQIDPSVGSALWRNNGNSVYGLDISKRESSALVITVTKPCYLLLAAGTNGSTNTSDMIVLNSAGEKLTSLIANRNYELSEDKTVISMSGACSVLYQLPERGTYQIMAPSAAHGGINTGNPVRIYSLVITAVDN